MNTMLQSALGYANGGNLSVIPCDKVTKRPSSRWKPYQHHIASEAIVRGWFAYTTKDAGLAVVCGRVSGGLEVLDFDKSSLWELWKELVESQALGLLDRLPQVQTQSGGYHVYYRCEIIEGNLKLAKDRVNGELKTCIETRGEGGYALAPPTLGYTLLSGDLVDIPTITPEERAILLDAGRAFNRHVMSEVGDTVAATGEGRPGDDFNERGDVRAILQKHGWTLVYRHGKVEHWRRPGKNQGTSATFNYIPRRFYPFTTNGNPFEAETSYSPFAVYALLEHGGNFEEAAQALAAQGYGKPRQKKAQAKQDLCLVKESNAPPLPEYARLSPTQIAEATNAGRWLDDYTAFASKASPLTPQPFHVAAGLFAGALAIARRLHLKVSVKANTIYPNLYELFVGHSTRPRKTTALRILRGLICEADMSHFLLADRQTPEAMALDLTTKMPGGFDSWVEDEQREWLRERAIAAQRGWLLEEASHLLDSFNRDYSAGLLPLVLDLYDASDRGPRKNTISRGREQIEDAYLSIFGATTYGAMAAHAQNPVHWRNGLWARFALVGSDESGAWKFWPPSLDYPPDLVRRLWFIAYGLLPMPEARIETKEIVDDDGESRKVKVVVLDPPLESTAVEISREAWEAWERYARAVSFDMLPEKPEKVPPQFYASYGRLGTMLIKVAMILATFDAGSLPIQIETRHTYRAQLIVEGWRANLHQILKKVAEVSADDLAEQVKAVLAQNGVKWTTRRDLLRALNLKWSEVEATISDLEASGEIERRPKKSKRGPPSEEYRLVLE